MVTKGPRRGAPLGKILKHQFQSVLIGTGCNSLGDTINLIRYSLDQGYKGAFLINYYLVFFLCYIYYIELFLL